MPPLPRRPALHLRALDQPARGGQLLSGHHRLHMDGKPVNHHSGSPATPNTPLVDRGSVVVIDRSLPLDVAALFGCAVVTGVGAVVNTGKIEPGSSVAIVGGWAAWPERPDGRGARGARARIVAIDLSDEKLGLARQLGATDT